MKENVQVILRGKKRYGCQQFFFKKPGIRKIKTKSGNLAKIWTKTAESLISPTKQNTLNNGLLAEASTSTTLSTTWNELIDNWQSIVRFSFVNVEKYDYIALDRNSAVTFDWA